MRKHVTHRLRHLAVSAMVAGSLVTGAGLATASVAEAGTDSYCNSCYLAGYNSGTLDPNYRYLITSYIHDLTYSNGWVCAGAIGQLYSCSYPDIASYYNQPWTQAFDWSHVHAAIYANAHADF